VKDGTVLHLFQRPDNAKTDSSVPVARAVGSRGLSGSHGHDATTPLGAAVAASPAVAALLVAGRRDRTAGAQQQQQQQPGSDDAEAYGLLVESTRTVKFLAMVRPQNTRPDTCHACVHVSTSSL
jgi:hypothetical protein